MFLPPPNRFVSFVCGCLNLCFICICWCVLCLPSQPVFSRVPLTFVFITIVMLAMSHMFVQCVQHVCLWVPLQPFLRFTARMALEKTMFWGDRRISGLTCYYVRQTQIRPPSMLLLLRLQIRPNVLTFASKRGFALLLYDCSSKHHLLTNKTQTNT